jgi:hypothetical protein
VIEPAVAVLVGRQEEGVLMAQARLGPLVLAPAGGGQRPDVGLGKGWFVAARELAAFGEQGAAGLLG